MKSKFLSLLLTGMIVLTAFKPMVSKPPPTCKYAINEIDKFTGKLTRITKTEKIFSTFFSVGEFKAIRIDTSFSFGFYYGISSYSNFDPYSIKPGNKIVLLMENEKTITLTTLDEIKGVKKTTIGLPPVYSCYLNNVSYSITKVEIDQLLQNKVKSIRFYCHLGDGKEYYIDNDIKERNRDDIQQLIKCVL